MPPKKARAVFLDRDGTINIDRHYLSDPSQFELTPGETGPALRRLQDAGFLLIVVTNQSGIGRGYYTEADMHAVNERMSAVLAGYGVRLAKIYYSPEAPEKSSRGRKPSPQFLFDAREEFNLDLSRCFMIGDKFIDLETGWKAGCARSILVRTGYGAEVERSHIDKLRDALVVDDLAEAADKILSL